jgi:hypothetical protein
MLQLMGYFETLLKSQANENPVNQLQTTISQENLA